MQPQSAICSDPVSSPAPFRTAVPAGTGSACSVSTGPGSTAVTPVRATPRPEGGSGSSRQTVTWPTVTLETSVIAFAAPGLESADAQAQLAKPRTALCGSAHGASVQASCTLDVP